MNSRSLCRATSAIFRANRRFITSIPSRKTDEESDSNNLLKAKLGAVSLASAALITTDAGFKMTATQIAMISQAPKIAFGMLLLSPIATCMKIHKEQSVGELSAFPFVSFIGNCGVWSVYGLLAENPTIYQANIAGFAAGCLFTGVYARYGSIPMQTWSFAIGMNALAAGCAFGLEKEMCLNILGTAGAGTAVVLLSSPLVALGNVIKSKDSSSMPWQVSLGMFVNASVWTIFGWTVVDDPFVWAPNGLGAAASAVQLAVIAKYPPKAATA